LRPGQVTMTRAAVILGMEAFSDPPLDGHVTRHRFKRGGQVVNPLV